MYIVGKILRVTHVLVCSETDRLREIRDRHHHPHVRLFTTNVAIADITITVVHMQTCHLCHKVCPLLIHDHW